MYIQNGLEELTGLTSLRIIVARYIPSGLSSSFSRIKALTRLESLTIDAELLDEHSSWLSLAEHDLSALTRLTSVSYINIGCTPKSLATLKSLTFLRIDMASAEPALSALTNLQTLIMLDQGLPEPEGHVAYKDDNFLACLPKLKRLAWGRLPTINQLINAPALEELLLLASQYEFLPARAFALRQIRDQVQEILPKISCRTDTGACPQLNRFEVPSAKVIERDIAEMKTTYF
jgi:hypothetical protein